VCRAHDGERNLQQYKQGQQQTAAPDNREQAKWSAPRKLRRRQQKTQRHDRILSACETTAFLHFTGDPRGDMTLPLAFSLAWLKRPLEPGVKREEDFEVAGLYSVVTFKAQPRAHSQHRK
jgi:hypothetical protein